MFNPIHPLLQKTGNGDLSRMAAFYGTDKDLNGYCHIYESYFNTMRNDQIRLLELGVGSPAAPSLKMWREFFPHGQIFGIDHTPECQQDHGERIKIEIGDIKNISFITQFAQTHGPFDIIIDDAGHYQSEMLLAFNTLWPYVKENSIYVIEDLFTSYCPVFEGGLLKQGTSIERLKQTLDDLHVAAFKKTSEAERFKPFSISPPEVSLSVAEQTLYSVHNYQGISFLFKGTKFC